MSELHRELRRCRAAATQEAERVGAHVAALATSPVPVEPSPLRSELVRELPLPGVGALSDRYPTIEVRIADVCLRTGDAVLIAGLIRALVETEARAWRDGKLPPRARTELLRLADLLARGNGAAFQREEFRRSGRLPAMVDHAASVTAS